MGRRTLMGAAALALLSVAASPATAHAQGAAFREFPTRSPRVGEEAPDFTLTDHTGQPVSLSTLRCDGVVVLEFGAIT